ncbi:two pore calcium channel protein 1A-like isoform X2 [Quercus suber]|uniref:two pore calcium channel protein 1A-like isoform X2 n=1 Tax=Quercus suber TaxID=58331 RepID=UPI0032DFC2FB
MEKPLLSGESSRATAADRKRERRNRSEAIAYGSNFEKAAALVDLKPLWCTNYSTDSCNDRDYYFLGQLPYLTGGESLIYEGISLFILVIHTFFPISYEGYCLYCESLLNRLKVALLLIWVADLLVYALYLSSGGFDYLPFRIAPYIRVVFFMLNFSWD